MDQIPVGLRAASRALSDVVAPAVDATHAQAHDQLRLVIEYIDFVIQRLDHVHDLAHFEHRHNYLMATELQKIVVHHGLLPNEVLATSIEHAERFMPVGAPPLQAIRDATASLAFAVADVVRGAPALESEVRREVERCVLSASATRIGFERSWYLPLELDNAPHEVLPLSCLLPASPV
ncbi:hypothetical protein [Burkholderia sp. S171]|uniref:hypothetical protein n=1 Tax=Burkholderia sp. S171 TaxID=1641860 RepID=UPI00131E0A46|nr:hypothetical protein [Burkholderia sp. S171]